ncbi:hypothetical protein BDK51DRAFT_30807 [Blyttiomyces helicus]|uniref:Uncharacterized protein n=1 Tax=Blyttiomyces helicus TaxID=388810 RepID=A0A4P9WJH6_9FUNG|nr:hypothetical protein BDK51DRAFT_30807 [Blyttiomyces helicus]|eukprot:RKO91658.1 hypothetical protein BDK51DRAFT_30807 [Blyttiomyces helicus]
MVKQRRLSRFQFNEHQLSSLNQLFPNNTYPPKILLHHQLPDNIREDRARRALRPHGLWPAWPPPQDDLGTPRWRTSDSYKVGTKLQRFLQCRSGTDPAAATRTPKRKAKGRSTHAFSSCLAHVQITYEVVLDAEGQEDLVACGRFLAIHGVLEHSENCNELPFRGAPTRPHPTIVATAMEELRVGIPSSRILAYNTNYLMV